MNVMKGKLTMSEERTWLEASDTDFSRQDSRTFFVLNAWSLPLWLSSRNRARQRKNRRISEEARFQLCTSARDVGVPVMSTGWWRHYPNIGHFVLAVMVTPINRGGLVTLIKDGSWFESTFIPFPKPEAGNFEEKHSGKGVLLVTDREGLTIGNCHLYSSGPEERHLTESQFQIVLALAKSYPRLIIGGDYNLPCGTSHEIEQSSW